MDDEGDERRGVSPPPSMILDVSYLPEEELGIEDSSPETLPKTQPSGLASILERIRSLQGHVSSASRTQRNRLMAGLIGFPIVVGVLCFFLYMMVWADYDSRSLECCEEVQMDGRTWTVYEFHMPSRFEDDFPADNGWRVKIRYDDSDNDYRIDSTEDDSGIIIDEDGSEWLSFSSDVYDQTLHIQVEEEVMRLAVGWTPDKPVKVSYSYTVDSVFFGFQWTVFLVWPVCTFAAIKWGRATNQPEFTYGVMVSGGLATLLILAPLLDMLDDGLPWF